LHEGLIAKIAALQLQQVEGINARGHVPTVQQREEVWLTVTTGSDKFAIDDAGLRRQPKNGCSDPREPAS
jgi:hypothetical protein